MCLQRCSGMSSVPLYKSSHLSPPSPSVLSVPFVASLLNDYHLLMINVIFTGIVFKKSQYLKSSYPNWVFISAVKYSWEFVYRETLRYSLKLMCAVCLSAKKGKCTQEFQVSLLMCKGENWDATVMGARKLGAETNCFINDTDVLLWYSTGWLAG